jgi:outer membrane receptor protein involved in Fe transport
MRRQCCSVPPRCDRCPAWRSAASRALLAVAPWLAASSVAAQPAPGGQTGHTDATEIGEIVVKGQALRDQAVGVTTTTLTTEDIVERRVVEVEQLFRDVPGMNVRDYGLPGVANQIVIRGFGNGAHGGDLGVVVDGVPLNEANSHADGYVDVNVLVPLEIDALTVFRGPISPLYGNFNRGGLIAIETRKTGEYVEGDVSGGSFGTYDAQLALGADYGAGGRVNGAGEVFTSEGFRPQSESVRGTLAGRYAVDLSEGLDVALSTRLHASESDNPAYLNLAQFTQDPYGVDRRVQNDGSEKRFGTLRADLNYTIAPRLRLLTFAYATRQDFTRWFSRPVGVNYLQREETYDRTVYGAGASLNGRAMLADRPVNYVVGVETFTERTEFQFYDGLQNRRRVNPALNDRESEITSLSAFGQANVSVHPLLDLSLGFRGDTFSGDCTRLGLEAGNDPCDDLNEISALTPKLGVQSQVLPWLRLRASYAEGFAIPNGFTKFAIGAQALEPNTFEQLEVGLLASLADTLTLDVAAYRLRSSEEFRTVSPGVFENSGATLRRGVEADVRWEPYEQLEFGLVYAYAGSQVEENPNPALIGRLLPGVPNHTATVSAAWTPVPAFRVNAAYRYVGEYAFNALNTGFAPAYDVIDVGVSYDLATRTPVRLYANIDNATDETYAASFNSLNSIAPGAPVSLRAGLQVGF